MKVTILRAGYCVCPEHLAIQGGRWKNIRFPAMFALLEHERFGPMLFDTGYSERFFEQTRKLPERIYRLMTPVTLRAEELAVNQLEERGLRAKDITRIFISHFHADHVAALADFSSAQYVYLANAWDAVRGARGLQAISRAFLPGMIPADFEERSRPIGAGQRCPLPPHYAPFTEGYDLLGDETVMAVELPGHATGQMGLFSQDGDRMYFFVADAAWLRHAIRDNRPPSPLANLIFSDADDYRRTLTNLHEYGTAHDHVDMIPSHCEETLAGYGL